MEPDVEEICVKPDITAISMVMNINPDEHPSTASSKNKKNKQGLKSVNKKSSKKKNISTRVSENDTVERISCPICDTTFKTRAYQKQHLKYAHATEADVVECPQCYRSFRSIAHLRYHNRSVHAEVKDIPCNICQKTFYNKKRLVDHMYSVHPDPNKRVFCQICNKSSKTQDLLKAHMRNVHAAEENHVSCSHCNQMFKNNVLLNSHVKRKHPVDETEYRCHPCNKTLPSIISYREHMTNAHIFEIVQCQVCSLSLKNPRNLLKHMKNMHGDEKSKKLRIGNLTCSHCNKRFAKKMTLKCHLERCHSENRETNFKKNSTNVLS